MIFLPVRGSMLSCSFVHPSINFPTVYILAKTAKVHRFAADVCAMDIEIAGLTATHSPEDRK